MSASASAFAPRRGRSAGPPTSRQEVAVRREGQIKKYEGRQSKSRFNKYVALLAAILQHLTPASSSRHQNGSPTWQKLRAGQEESGLHQLASTHASHAPTGR
eukprot:SM000289S10417  [mRNA]  locus=s289:99626:100443:- [translate_table: standard]